MLVATYVAGVGESAREIVEEFFGEDRGHDFIFCVEMSVTAISTVHLGSRGEKKWLTIIPILIVELERPWNERTILCLH